MERIENQTLWKRITQPKILALNIAIVVAISLANWLIVGDKYLTQERGPGISLNLFVNMPTIIVFLLCLVILGTFYISALLGHRRLERHT